MFCNIKARGTNSVFRSSRHFVEKDKQSRVPMATAANVQESGYDITYFNKMCALDSPRETVRRMI